MSERQEREYNRGEPYDHEFVQPPSSAADASICSFCGHKQIEHTAPWRVGGSAEPVAPPPQPVQNTDRELWRERPGDYYADSIFVTEGGGIGLNCGGSVFVKPVREWHRLAMEQARREPPPHACTQPGFNDRADVCPACALARAPQGDPPEETVWLIERDNSNTERHGVIQWWSADCLHPWTTDAINAVRFARKLDADRVIDGHGELRPAFATEHLWVK